MIQSSIGERSRLILASRGEVFSTNFDAGQRSRELALQSVVRKFGELPKAASAFETFESADGRVRAERSRMDEFDAWSLRFSEPDSTTAGREWIVEVSSLNGSAKSQFSCRLSCYSADQNFGFIPATPRALKDVVAAMSFVNSGYVLTSEVQEVGIDVSLDELVKQLEEKTRWWNCLVVAESFTEKYGLDASTIHRHVTGCANTFFLPTELEPEFAGKVGREFTVFGGGARTFRPNFSSGLSEQTAHPVIKVPFSGSKYGVDRARHILASDAFHSSVERLNLRTLVPSFATMRQLSAKLLSESARKSGNSEDIISTLEARVAAEEKNAAESVQFAIQHDEERKVTQAVLENEQAINYGLNRFAFLDTSPR